MGQNLVDQWMGVKSEQTYYIENSWYMNIPITSDFGSLCKFYLSISTGRRDFPILINGWEIDPTNACLRFIIFNNSTYITPSNIGSNVFFVCFLIIDTIS